MPGQVEDTLELMGQCLMANTEVSLIHWHKLYTSHLTESAQLIQFIDSNWSQYKSALDVPDFHNSLEAFQDYNSSVINKEGLELATIGCQSLSSKIRRGGMSWFPWKTASLLLLGRRSPRGWSWCCSDIRSWESWPRLGLTSW